MKSILQASDAMHVEHGPSGLVLQAASILLHTILALGAWMGLMVAGYAIRPARISQWAILLLSMAIPAGVGIVVCSIRKDEMASMVWLIGVIWMLLFSLYLLDLPTGPAHCFQCSATEKLTRSFLSWPRPGGLVDDDAPFLATWPAASLIGYSIGAKVGMLRSK